MTDTITVDGLTEAELQTLDLHRQALLLNHIMATLRDLRDQISKAIQDEADARTGLLFSPADPNLRSKEIQAKARHAVLNERVKTYRDWKSALQSLIRTANG